MGTQVLNCHHRCPKRQSPPRGRYQLRQKVEVQHSNVGRVLSDSTDPVRKGRRPRQRVKVNPGKLCSTMAINWLQVLPHWPPSRTMWHSRWDDRIRVFRLPIGFKMTQKTIVWVHRIPSEDPQCPPCGGLRASTTMPITTMSVADHPSRTTQVLTTAAGCLPLNMPMRKCPTSISTTLRINRGWRIREIPRLTWRFCRNPSQTSTFPIKTQRRPNRASGRSTGPG